MFRDKMPQSPISLMLFAAGFGSRMAPLTDHRPKPLLEVAGRTLLDHALDQTRGFNFEKRVVNVHYLAAQIINHLKSEPALQISHEKEALLETGGGLRAALGLLGPWPVLTLNTDAVWLGQNPIAALLSAWQPDRMDALLLLGPLAAARGHSGFSDFALNAAGQIKRDKSTTGLLYLGAQIIKTDMLLTIDAQKFSLNLLWDQMIDQGRAFGFTYAGDWCDVGRPQNIDLATALLKAKYARNRPNV